MVVKSSADQIKNQRDNIEECSSMDASMTIAGDANNAGVTVFANEACDSVEVLGNYMPMSLALPQAELQDIKAYFERPRLVTRGSVTFGTTSSLTTTIYGINNASFIAQFPQWTQRLAGAYGIRFTLNFRLQVAATAFHQGVIALSWQYGPTSNPTFSRYNKSFACTNVPHVRLDLAEHTMVELKVPFLYQSEFWNIVSNTSDPTGTDYGSIGVTPILPAVSVAGISPATFDLYAYLSDIELLGVDVINPSTVTLQSGGGLITREVKQSKVVSGTLSNLSKISKFVSVGVPSLAAIAGPASWALDTAAGIAKYFGYSRPAIQDPPVKVYRSNYVGEYHVDEPAVCEIVGAIQGNTTTIDTSLGATEVDEMALSHVLSQWSQVALVYVNTTNSHGTAIYSAPVSPSVFWFRTGTTIPFSNIRVPINIASLTANTGNSILPSTLMYISSFFRYWRGSIKFRFTFAKTKLHGGRYMVTYNPGNAYQFDAGTFGGSVEGPEVVATYQQPYGNSMIMDLKDGNVFDFVVPFVSGAPYRTFNSSTGGLTVVCMDPLQATATVTTQVPLLVEVCGGSDYEVSDFGGVYYPIQQNGTVYTQSGGQVITTIKPPHSNTMGERLMSLKQLIQIPAPVLTTVNAGLNNLGAVCPWFVNNTYNRVLALTGLPNSNQLPSTFTGANSVGMNLAKCYAYVKGGTDYHQYINDNSAFQTVYQTGPYGNVPAGSNALNKQAFPSSAPGLIQSGGLPIHARLPSYQPLVRIPSCAIDTQFGGTLEPTATGALGFLGHLYRVSVFASAASQIYTLRGASDDAQMAHYMGPPPIFIPNNIAAGNFDGGFTYLTG